MIDTKKTFRRRYIGFLLGATVLALGGVWAYQTWSVQTLGQAHFAPAQGERLVYGVALDVEIAAAEGNVGRLKLTGDWVLEGMRDGVLARVDRASLENEGQHRDSAQGIQDAVREFAEPIVISYAKDGSIDHVRENPRSRLQVRTMVKSIAAFSQLVTPEVEPKDAWTTSESDTTGSYDAAYQVHERGRASKRKTSYTSIESASDVHLNENARLELLGSTSDFTVRSDGRLGKLRVDERVRVHGEYLEGLVTTTRLVLTFKRAEEMEHVPVPDVTRLHVSKLSKHAGKDDFTIDTDYARVAGFDFEEVMEVLSDLPPYKERNREELRKGTRQFIGLTALMRTNPENIELALEMIREADPLSQTLWDALASAGTPEAQEALRQVIEMPQWDVPERRGQMIGLSMVKDPSPETVEFLASKFDDEDQGRQARYGMGTAVFNLKDKRPEAATQALAYLTDALKNESDPVKQVGLLEALGNTGDPRAFAIIEPYLASTNLFLRAAATEALRLIPGEQVDQILATKLAEDAEEHVRLSAVTAVASRGPTRITTAALVVAETGDPSNNIRALASSALAQFQAQEPAYVALVSELRTARGT